MMKKRLKREGKKRREKEERKEKEIERGKGREKGKTEVSRSTPVFPSATWDLASLKLIMTLDKNPTSPHLSVETP